MESIEKHCKASNKLSYSLKVDIQMCKRFLQAAKTIPTGGECERRKCTTHATSPTPNAYTPNVLLCLAHSYCLGITAQICFFFFFFLSFFLNELRKWDVCVCVRVWMRMKIYACAIQQPCTCVNVLHGMHFCFFQEGTFGSHVFLLKKKELVEWNRENNMNE